LGTRVFQLSRVYCQLWVSHPYPYPYQRKFSCSCMVFSNLIFLCQNFWQRGELGTKVKCFAKFDCWEIYAKMSWKNLIFIVRESL
jgi:hypothetical protein